MTINVNRTPTSENLLLVLEKAKGESGSMINPQQVGKTDAIGFIVKKGVSVPEEYKIGAKVDIPMAFQKQPRTFEGNTFCSIHYLYITSFLTEPYLVDLEK